MREYFPVIKKTALFQGISEDDLDGMLTCLGARTASYSKNQPIFWEGEPASLIGVVLTGKVQIAKDDFFGNRNIISMMEPPWAIVATSQITHFVRVFTRHSTFLRLRR